MRRLQQVTDEVARCPECGSLVYRVEGSAVQLYEPMPTHLVWTTDKPTQPGYYWMQNEDWGPGIVYIWQHPLGRLEVEWGDDSYILDGFDADKWAGPLPVPQEEER